MLFFPLGQNLDQEEVAKKDRYTVTKLLEIMAVREIGALLGNEKSEHSCVIVNCLTPGVCKSEFNREAEAPDSARLMKWGTKLVVCTARSTEVGARTLVAGLEAGEESRGAYMEDSCVAR